MILHITTRECWEKAKQKGEYRADSLASEGFIHCSTAAQTVETANIFYGGQNGLVLLSIDEQKLQAECRFEAPSGGAPHSPEAGLLFPHVYGPINLDAVVQVSDFPPKPDGSFSLPADLTLPA